MNERLSPNLMVCKSEIVECIMEQMHEMEENIARARKGDIKVSEFLLNSLLHRKPRQCLQRAFLNL